jgi:uncharacterized protein YbjT (DUF2867 family)
MPAIYLIGASGFIGRHLARALRDAGHSVVESRVDLTRMDASSWRVTLPGVDVVVNTAGVFREAPGRSFESVHVRGPVTLFAACAELGVRVIHFSALGADAQAATRFHLTKKAADDALLALSVESVVLQPSLVHGTGGASARLFGALASMPVTPLPGDGAQRIQPVHVDDVCAAVVAIVSGGAYAKKRIPIVGPQPTTLRAYLADLRRAMGLGEARFVRVPVRAARLAIGNEAIDMLERGNTADAQPLAQLLGRAPRPASAFDADATAAKLAWLLPLLRVSIALVWIIAGVVSLGLYPLEESLAMLARAGIIGMAAPVALYGAAAVDLAMGVATLLWRSRALWVAQMTLIVGYTVVLTAAIPELWLHPFGPLAKNLPLLVALALLCALERR